VSGLHSTTRSARALACACSLLALAAGTARGAAEPHPRVGRLPGFPAIRGVVPVLGSSAALSAHEQLVNEAFAAAVARSAKGRGRAAEPNKELVAPCEGEGLFMATHDACYRGGPVLRDPTVHLIFWQGPVEAGVSSEPNVKLLPVGYVEKVTRYFEDVVHDNGAQTNVFAVDRQYFDRNAKGEAVPGEYALSFDKSTDVTVDNAHFPKHAIGGCTDESENSKGPCLLDSDLRGEVEKIAGTSTKGLKDIYLLFTPPGVGGCLEAASGECAYRQYCAYHGDFGGDGHTPGNQTIYVDLPYLGEAPGCDSGVHPNEELSLQAEELGEDHGADAVIDTGSHEVNEAITDPLGSQCENGASECEPNAWTDVIGQEIADKCLPPESTVLGRYGEPLGELIPGRGASLYNQVIDGDHYWTQREWSNEAGLLEGGCVQRTIGASFTVSPNAEATVPVTLDGSPSGAPGDPAVYWVWNLGEGEQVGTASASFAHTFAQAGEHEVGLTAYDAYGNAEAIVETVNVGSAPTPPPPPLPQPPVAITVREPASPPGHLTAAQLAAKLGLPANGRKLSGGGSIAECPPACAVTLQLYARVTTVAHKHRTTKLVPIGTAHTAFGVKGTGALTLSLNAKGRALLHRSHAVPCRLLVIVEGQEGGTWQIVRSLMLTSAGSAARHARR
jgi:hypothetical protein